MAGLINQERLIRDTWGQSYYTGLFALQTFAQLSLAFLIGFLVRKAFLALGIFLFYYIVLENLLVGWLSWKEVSAASYFPLEISDRLIPKPGFWYITNPHPPIKGLGCGSLAYPVDRFADRLYLALLLQVESQGEISNNRDRYSKYG